MKKIILVTLALCSINAWAFNGGTFYDEPSYNVGSSNTYSGTRTMRCDSNGENCQNDCINCL